MTCRIGANRLIVAVSLATAVVALAFFSSSLHASLPSRHSERSPIRRPITSANLAKLPLFFEPNCGQTDARAKFVAHAAGATVFLTATGAVVEEIHHDLSKALHGPAALDGRAHVRPKLGGFAVAMNFAGADPRASAEGTDKLPGISNYFIGNHPANWKTGIPNYERVRYRSIYPGVDLVYYGNQGRLEYDLVVSPQADPRAISLAFDGVDALRINRARDAVLQIGENQLTLRRPIAYQPDGSSRTPVTVNYRKVGKDRVTLTFASYDRSRPLVIDPILIYSTYLGDTFAQGQAVAISPAAGGGAVVAGWIAEASTFPTTSGAFGNSITGSVNAIIAQFNPTGSSLAYSTIFGGSHTALGSAGSSTDEALGVAVDTRGNIYATGFTNATDFPTANTSIPGGTTLNQGNNPEVHSDAFAVEFNAGQTGSAQLVYGTYLGGSLSDSGNAIAVDGSGNAYIAGSTFSTDFPTSGTNAYQNSDPGTGAVQGFVTKLTMSGGNVTEPYSSYFGEAAPSPAISHGAALQGIAADNAGNVYVAGSAGAGFGVTSGTFHGAWDAIAARIDTTASSDSLKWARYIGGSGAAWANSIAVLPGCASTTGCPSFVGGATTSADFPTNADTAEGQTPYQSTLSGFVNGFVAALNSTDGSSFYSTLLGGESFDEIRGIAADQLGNAYLTGVTESSSYPVLNASSASLGSSINGPSGALYTSTDGGATLTAVAGWSSTTQGSIRSSKALAFDTGTVPATIYAGSTTGLWVSADGGSTFSTPAAAGLSGEIHSVNVSSSAGILLGTSAGLWQSTDSGAHFHQRSTVVIGSNPVYAIDQVTQFSNFLVASAANGFFVSDDATATFTAASGLPSGVQVLASVVDGNSCVPSGSPTSCAIYVGTDHGVYSGTISSSSESLTLSATSLNFAVVTALAADATTSPSTLYAATLGGAGVIASTDGFTTLASTSQYSTPQNVFALALDTATSNPATVYVGAASQELTSVFASTDGGATYSQGIGLAGTITGLQVLSGKVYVADYLTQDAFLTQLNGFGSRVIFSAYIGGTNVDIGNGVAVDTADDVFVAGSTFSTDFPSGGSSPYQTTLGSGSGFVNAFLTDVNLAGLVASPASLVFPPTLFGNTGLTSAAQTVTLLNTQTTTVNFTADPAIKDSTDFTITSNTCTSGGSGSLAPEATCTVSVAFTPTALGPNAGHLSFSDDATNQPQIFLSGIGQAPPIQFSTIAIAFPTTVQGNSSLPKLLTLTNVSGVGETVTGLASTNSDFSVSGTSGGATCGSTPITLNNATSCSISVTFTPSTATSESGVLRISDNAAESPQMVSLNGSGTTVELSIKPASITYAAREVGTTSPLTSVKLTNGSGGPITLTDIETTNPDFHASTTCPRTIVNRSHCLVDVTFTPSIIGTQTASLVISPAAPAGTQTVPLSGTGIVSIKLSTKSLIFGKVAVGQTSAPKSITIKNPNLVPVSVSSIISTNSEFAQSNTCGNSIPAELGSTPGSCKITVTFTPTTTGPASGVIQITDDAQKSPQQPKVSGKGT